MEKKTNVHAEEGTQELVITRVFDLPVELLFKAYEDPVLISQWMGTKVLKQESKKHGSYEYETNDAKGSMAFRAHGVFHDFVANQKITRTFEMEHSPFGVQIEFLEFEKLSAAASKLTMQVVYRSGALRDAMLKLPFAYGINMAHNRLEEIVSKLK